MFKPDFLTKVIGSTVKLPKPARRIWTDTRSLEPGDLFAAIPGEAFDGHDYIAEAAQKGAVGAISMRTDFKAAQTLPTDFGLIVVKDTTECLRNIAKAHRQNFKGKVFAVAGSNGKTTTKEWIAFLLEQTLGPAKVFKTKKSNNSILGIALSILQMREEDFAVIEIGIDEPGWMEKHLEVVAPNAGIITMIGEEHLNRLKDIHTVAEEELKLLHYLRKTNGKFVANIDSPYIADQNLPKDSLSFGLEKKAQIEGRYLAPNILKAFGLNFQNPLPGRHNAQNLLGALASVRILHPDLSLDQLKNLALSLPTFRGEAHRGLWLSFDRGIRVFDDCYNANPESMERALETFLELADGCHQSLVLGDMLDLGDASEKSHNRILNLALVSGVEENYLFGPLFSAAWERTKKISPPDATVRVQSFQKIEDLQEALNSNLKRDDCVMLKGSRGMGLERILKIWNS